MGVPVSTVETRGCGEVVLPEQFFLPRDGAHRALRRLMIALLEDAISEFQQNLFARSPHGRRLFREAERWLMEENESLLRFEDVCDVLELDADFVRGALRRWRADKVANLVTTEGTQRGCWTEPVVRLETARRRRALAGPRRLPRRRHRATSHTTAADAR